MNEQVFGKNRVVVVRSKSNGGRFAKINGFKIIPLEICQLAAGKDSWMRGIVAKCDFCESKQPLNEMEGLSCQKCYDEAGEENERMNAL